eukprot:Sspe_Gene.20768::Locus_7649_Transcript_1_1_Confidence_1.000_Length_2693::g.20768::m.20768
MQTALGEEVIRCRPTVQAVPFAVEVGDSGDTPDEGHPFPRFAVGPTPPGVAHAFASVWVAAPLPVARDRRVAEDVAPCTVVPRWTHDHWDRGRGEGGPRRGRRGRDVARQPCRDELLRQCILHPIQLMLQGHGFPVPGTRACQPLQHGYGLCRHLTPHRRGGELDRGPRHHRPCATPQRPHHQLSVPPRLEDRGGRRSLRGLRCNGVRRPCPIEPRALHPHVRGLPPRPLHVPRPLQVLKAPRRPVLPVVPVVAHARRGTQGLRALVERLSRAQLPPRVDPEGVGVLALLPHPAHPTRTALVLLVHPIESEPLPHHSRVPHPLQRPLVLPRGGAHPPPLRGVGRGQEPPQRRPRPLHRKHRGAHHHLTVPQSHHLHPHPRRRAVLHRPHLHAHLPPPLPRRQGHGSGGCCDHLSVAGKPQFLPISQQPHHPPAPPRQRGVRRPPRPVDPVLPFESRHVHPPDPHRVQHPRQVGPCHPLQLELCVTPHSRHHVAHQHVPPRPVQHHCPPRGQPPPDERPPGLRNLRRSVPLRQQNTPGATGPIEDHPPRPTLHLPIVLPRLPRPPRARRLARPQHHPPG